MRRFGEIPKTGQVYRQRPGAYAVIDAGAHVLLTEQTEPAPEIQLPGGGIDPGESPLAALHREVLEETGWTISVNRRLGGFLRYTYMPEYDLWARKVCHVYLCKTGLRRSAPREAFHRVLWARWRDASGLIPNAGDRWYMERAYRVRFATADTLV